MNMKMSTSVIVLLLVIALLSGVGLTGAQETAYSLRGFADQNGVYIGAAVYASHLQDPVHRETLSREFNMLTPENEAKACEVQARRGVFDFRHFDELVAFAEANNMVIHGHTLLWHQCMPEWLESGEFDREEAIQIMRDHIMTVVGRYKGRIAIWDVVNEAIADDGSGLRDTPWRSMIGDDYIELAFQFAHEADPDALLFYNDYGAEGLNSKSDAVYALVQDLVERGIPIHGVGLQMHITVGDTAQNGKLPADVLAQNIQRLGELGLEVQITEMDVGYLGETSKEILQQQAADYYRVMDTCLNSEYCTALIIWGVADHFSWLRYRESSRTPDVEPLLFDSKYKPKPAYFALLDVLARRAGATSLLSDEQVEAMLQGPDFDVDVPEPVKSDPAQLAPDSVPGVIYYAPFSVPITLDGDTGDWANVPRVTIDSGPMLLADNDTVMTFAVAADETHLYFLAEVQDSKLVYGTHEPGSGWYEEDSVEFYLNTTGDLDLSSYKPGVVQIAFLAANITQPDEPIIAGGNSKDAQADVIAIETEDGYLVEASVPLVTNVWSIEPEHQGVLGFQAHLNGSSAIDRDTKLIWSVYDTQDQSWTNPSVFGQLIFWDVTQ
jgi:GH35 family endo-1,4-beta-xylanase